MTAPVKDQEISRKVVGPDAQGTTFEVTKRQFNHAAFYPCHAAFNPNTDAAERASVDQYLTHGFSCLVVKWAENASASLAISLQTFDAYGAQWEAYFGRRRVSGTGDRFEWECSVFSTLEGHHNDTFDSENKARRFIHRFEYLISEYPSLLINPTGWGKKDWSPGYAVNNGLILLLRRLMRGAEPTVKVLP
jgi:hypothetical protein